MNSWLRCFVGTTLLLATTAAIAAFHLFRIEQIYSNTDGTVQFVVMHEGSGFAGEHFWQGQSITSTHAGVTQRYNFTANLPSSDTAGKRVLIATQGFANLKLITPDYVVPNGFLSLDSGTINYGSGADQVTYSTLPTNGVSAIDRNGTTIPNVATNFAGQTGSVTPAATTLVPAVGLWWNPDESGTGYNLDVKHGVLVVTMFTYESTGHSEWYLASGPLTDNGTRFTATLDKYRGGQCASCVYTGRPTLAGNDGNISITFSSPTTAVVNLPNNRVTNIVPQAF